MSGTDESLVVVTGASSGLGLAAAKRLLREGRNVIALSRSPAQPVSPEDESASRFCWIGCDIRSYRSLRRVVAELQERPLKGLVNAAGVVHRSPFLTQKRSEWTKMIATNLVGTLNATRVFAPLMIAKGGSIVNIASVVSLMGLPLRAVYAASKGAIAQFTRTLALELAPYGVRVNAVCPGAFKTPMTDDVTSSLQGLSWYTSQIPLGRLGEPDECAALIAFLLSDDASYITGSLIPIDGGWSA